MITSSCNCPTASIEPYIARAVETVQFEKIIQILVSNFEWVEKNCDRASQYLNVIPETYPLSGKVRGQLRELLNNYPQLSLKSSDLQIQFSSSVLNTHKLLFTNQSSFFRILFSRQFNQNDQLQLEDDCTTIEALFNFMGKGDQSGLIQNPLSGWVASDYFGVDEAKTICESQILSCKGSFISEKSCQEILKYNDPIFKIKLLSLIGEKIFHLFDTDDSLFESYQNLLKFQIKLIPHKKRRELMLSFIDLHSGQIIQAISYINKHSIKNIVVPLDFSENFLKEFLKELSNVKHSLDLHFDGEMTQSKAKIISEVLLSANNISKLKFRKTELHSLILKVLEPLLTHSTARCINFESNYLSNSAVEIFCRILIRNRHITHLNVKNNGISDEGVQKLQEVLVPSYHFDCLNFNNTTVGEESETSIAPITIPSDTHLQEDVTIDTTEESDEGTLIHDTILPLVTEEVVRANHVAHNETDEPNYGNVISNTILPIISNVASKMSFISKINTVFSSLISLGQ